ncbi:hypothetical protein ACWGB8_29700 [Kitasatospora sp. NPDC054939]
MTGLPRDQPPPAAPERSGNRSVPAVLLALHGEGFTGSVVLAGTPGGTVHLEEGLVTAVETPVAPSVACLLLKSRRVHESEWEAAETAVSVVARSGGSSGRGGASSGRGGGSSGRGGDLGEALVARGAIGAGELEAVCAAAAFDGAFVLALAPPSSWQALEGAPAARTALRPGIAPQRLLEETGRRMALLSRLAGCPPGELARRRIRPAAGPRAEDLRTPARYREILGAATGRRTARDIGFALGRGVFAVLLDAVRMDALHLLHREPVPAVPMAPSVAPRTAPSAPPTAAAEPLPRRVPGARQWRAQVDAAPATKAHRAGPPDTTEKSTS